MDRCSVIHFLMGARSLKNFWSDFSRACSALSPMSRSSWLVEPIELLLPEEGTDEELSAAFLTNTPVSESSSFSLGKLCKTVEEEYFCGGSYLT